MFVIVGENYGHVEKRLIFEKSKTILGEVFFSFAKAVSKFKIWILRLDHEVWRLDGCFPLKVHRKRPLAAIFPAFYTFHTPVAVDIEAQKCKLEFFFSFRKFLKKVEKKCEN